MDVHIENLPILGLRYGTINCHDRIIETPGCMLYTRCCAVPHLMPDLVGELDETHLPRLNQFSLSTCYERPGVDVLKQFQLGIKRLANLQERVRVVTNFNN